MKKNNLSIVILSLSILIFLSNCASRKPIGAFDAAKTSAAPDYSQLKFWAAHPQLTNNQALRTPLPSLKPKTDDAECDVFWVHPTTYTNQRGNKDWNGDLSNEKLNKKTDDGSILYQASAFNGVGRIFAPRYRQAHIHAYRSLDRESARQAFDVAYGDVKAAFEHYMKNWNNGKPIIIAAHSQGTQHAAKLLKEFFDDKPLRNRLVVAYIVGLPVQKNYFAAIPICEDSTRTGCFCSWRTYAKGHYPRLHNAELAKNVAVVNPLTWTTSENYAPPSINQGGVMYGFQMRPNIVDAQISEGFVWSTKPKFKGSFLMRTKNYHAGDYNLFYMNIRNDAMRRLNLFWKR
jgi:hypothetical protein